MSSGRVSLAARKDENRIIFDTNSYISTGFGRHTPGNTGTQLVAILKLQHDQAGMTKQMVRDDTCTAAFCAGFTAEMQPFRSHQDINTFTFANT